jgi:thiol-disulfide isomerase/thioredoxin
MRPAAALVRTLGALGAAALLAACTTSGLGAVIDGNGNKTSAKTGVTEWTPGERGKPIALSGKLLDGGNLDLASLHGHVVVVNVWGSWCGPCNEEAPALAAAYGQLNPKDVHFVGIDTRDPSAAAAQQFITNHDQTWPSLSDDDGTLLLAFKGKVNPNTVPSTLVLDREGRVAARVLGAVRTDTLTAIVDTVLRDPST